MCLEIQIMKWKKTHKNILLEQFSNPITKSYKEVNIDDLNTYTWPLPFLIWYRHFNRKWIKIKYKITYIYDERELNILANGLIRFLYTTFLSLYFLLVIRNFTEHETAAFSSFRILKWNSSEHVLLYFRIIYTICHY